MIKKPLAIFMALVLVLFTASGCDDGGGDGEDTQEDMLEDETGMDAEEEGDDAQQEDAAEDAADEEEAEEPDLPSPGDLCRCDEDCPAVDGQDGICVFGICMVKASAQCEERGSTLECPEHSRCWSLSGFDGSICWPDCDYYTGCAGACDEEGSCVWTQDTVGCDPFCSLYCPGNGTGRSPIGGPCERSADCADVGATCYPHYRSGENTGFTEGYCMIFQCPSPGAGCGTDGVCVANMGGAGVHVCMAACDGRCARIGYTCGSGGYCTPFCSGPEQCPEDYRCIDEICQAAGCDICSEEKPFGDCFDSGWCDEGVCSEEDYDCIGLDAMEPNNNKDSAKDLSEGLVEDLSICTSEDDWFRVAVPAGFIAQVTMTQNISVGDLDLIAYAEDSSLLGSRYMEFYPYSWRGYETGQETLAFYNQAGADDYYYVRVTGFRGESNYSLLVENVEWQDGETCTDLFTSSQCRDMSSLIFFPFPDPDDDFIGEYFAFDTVSNYRFLRREAVMLLRYAIAEVAALYPDTDPIGLIDMCQANAITPGYDVCDPRHPETTHDQGGNFDVAYYQTGPDNRARIVCGPGETNHDGYFCTSAAEDEHIVDLERQAYFQAAISRSPRLRVIGYDRVIGPLVSEEIDRLEGDGIITADEADDAKSKMTWGSGWPFHHHHVHISLQWL